MRRPLIAGNWKMNKTPSEAKGFAQELIKALPVKTDVEILICPPYTALSLVADIVKNTPIKLGAQNMYWEAKGAFTGEISGEFLKDIGCEYVILGHSERRQYFGETDETVNKKLHAALTGNLKPIICIGERLSERETNLTFDVIQKQLQGGFMNVGNIENVVVAYEPVWAIGTGKTATPEQAQEVHKYIRNFIVDKYDKNTADKMRILYGGSVTPENIAVLMKQPDIDGALVGGASLKLDSFLQLTKAGS
ncbi:MAG: triose-phosphate isomerase [Candidatus Latescibacteria bacterium]|nr:triose-phosphate isomerase [Candidatus Latescibacterota bacterium]